MKLVVLPRATFNECDSSLPDPCFSESYIPEHFSRGIPLGCSVDSEFCLPRISHAPYSDLLMSPVTNGTFLVRKRDFVSPRSMLVVLPYVIHASLVPYHPKTFFKASQKENAVDGEVSQSRVYTPLTVSSACPLRRTKKYCHQAVYKNCRATPDSCDSTLPYPCVSRSSNSCTGFKISH